MEYQISSKKKFSIADVYELWEFRELFYFFVWRDIKIKYKQTILGLLWVLIQPLLITTIFTLTLGKIIQPISNDRLPYPVYVMSGMLLWNLFSSGISNAANSMMNNAGIIKKIYFPRIIIPVTAILTSIIDFFVSLLIYIPFLYYYHIHFGWSILVFIPIALLFTIIITLGLGVFFSAVIIKYRDFKYIMPFFLQVLFFVSPIFFTAPALFNHRIVNILFKANPLNTALQLIRAQGAAEIDFTLLTLHSCSILLFLILALLFFKRTETFLADLV